MARGSLGIAGVSLEYRWKCVSCRALFCFVVLVLLIVITAAGSVGRAACLPSYHRAARGTRSSHYWPGDRGGNSPAYLRPTADAPLSDMRAGRCANALARHVPIIIGFAPWP